jgi:NAD(P)-dependent dehydrogenase (short-subunit alcohol dehydrogenase family)
MGDLDGKVAIVTGGSLGIGKATALTFADGGVRVVVSARRSEEGEKVVKEIRDNGGEAIFVSADVSKSVDVQKLIAATVDHFGGLDFACNNAGIVGEWNSLTDISEEQWDSVLGINLKGTWLCMKYEIPEMERRGQGAIVNISSINGMRGSASGADYTASKHGIIGLTRAAARGYASKGIRVNAICPGYTVTPMLEGIHKGNIPDELGSRMPMGRLGSPEEIARAIVWMCSNQASYITGQTLVVDGGFLS